MATTKELSVKDWEQEIDRGLRYRRELGREDDWADNEAIFNNTHPSCRVAGPNLIASTVDAMLSQLSVPTPYITTKARSAEYVQAAPVVEAVDNHLLVDLQVRQRAEETVLNATLYGVGVLKFGFDSLWGWDGKFDVGGKLAKTGQTFTQRDTKGNAIEFGPAKPGMPWVESVLPHDIVVPWGTKDLDSAPWIAHRTVRHIDDIKADPKYENKADLQPSMSMEDWVKSYSTVMKPYRMGDSTGKGTDETEYVELWEIHDVRTHKVLVIATGYDEFLREDMDGLAIEGLPFVAISFTPRSRTFWVTPDVSYLRAVQNERTDISLQNNKQRRIGVAQTVVDEDAFEPDELEKLTRAEVGAFVKKRAGIPMNEAVSRLGSYNNQQLWNEADRCERDAQNTIGLSRNQQGSFDTSSRRTATESAVVDKAAGLRMGRRQLAISDLYVAAMRKLNAICFECWEIPMQVQYIGVDGIAAWAKFNGSTLKGEYNYDVGFSNDAGESKQGRQQMAQMLLQNITAPFLDPAAVVRYAARAYNDPDLTLCFKPQLLIPQPMGAPDGQQGLTPTAPLPGAQPQPFAATTNVPAGLGGDSPWAQAAAVSEPHIGARGGAQAVGAGV